MAVLTLDALLIGAYKGGIGAIGVCAEEGGQVIVFAEGQKLLFHN